MMNEMSSAPILSIQHLFKSYGPKPALSDLNLQINAPRIIGLLGPNGSGKTTLFKLIAGLQQPTSGTIQVCGEPVGAKSRALTSYLPDKMHLNPGHTVRQHIDFFADFFDDFDRQRAEDLAHSLRLEPNQVLKTLSKGTQERLQLVLAMARRARLYLLDEPIGGVDPATRDFILDIIRSNYLESSALIISTHLVSDIEHIFDDVLFLHTGKIHLAGAVDDLRKQHGKTIDQLFREVFHVY
ncbi:MAG: ABC transporter ATP-binding protein [Bacillota bacterium]|nr:ABC transporter ATP-binding protein [Bacillota bacterium]